MSERPEMATSKYTFSFNKSVDGEDFEYNGNHSDRESEDETETFKEL
jgi:hypothetical protein